MKFEELNLEPSLMDGLSAMNFQDMTPVQEQSIPVILEGKDVIACAQTGTGKTAAYLLPLLNKILTEPHDEDAVNAIIMAPTRELAQQIDQQLEGFSYFLSVSSVAVYGGNDASAWEQQKHALKMGADIVVATPGRLISHISLDNVNFSKVKYFVLDEADRMLDMGFYDDIIQIVKQLPTTRQTIMFSATMPPKIQKLAESILTHPTLVNIAISKPAEGIEQGAYICYETQKLQLLTNILKTDDTKTIVFSSSKLKVREICRQLQRKGLSVAEIHSDLEQEERDEALLNFKSGKVNVLVATDIVSRGIDIDDIELVINYDVPRDVEDYIHRIGRTARANRKGKGITFVSEEDQDRFHKVERFLDKEIDKLSLPDTVGEGPLYAPRLAKGKSRNNHRSNNQNRQNNPSKSSHQHSNFKSKENQNENTDVQKHSQHSNRRPFNRERRNDSTNNSQQQESLQTTTPVENVQNGETSTVNPHKKKRPYWKNKQNRTRQGDNSQQMTEPQNQRMQNHEEV